MLNALLQKFSPKETGNITALPYRVTHQLHWSFRIVAGVLVVGVYYVSASFTLDLFEQFAHTPSEVNRYRFIAIAFEFGKCFCFSVGAALVSRKMRLSGFSLLAFGTALTVYSVVATMGSVNVTNAKGKDVALHNSTAYKNRQSQIELLTESIKENKISQVAERNAHQLTKARATGQFIEQQQQRLDLLINSLDKVTPDTDAASSFFDGLAKLFAMIGYVFDPEKIKVFFELITAILIELIASALAFIGGIKAPVRIVHIMHRDNVLHDNTAHLSNAISAIEPAKVVDISKKK
jgi:hypothetical protein